MDERLCPMCLAKIVGSGKHKYFCSECLMFFEEHHVGKIINSDSPE